MYVTLIIQGKKNSDSANRGLDYGVAFSNMLKYSAEIRRDSNGVQQILHRAGEVQLEIVN